LGTPAHQFDLGVVQNTIKRIDGASRWKFLTECSQPFGIRIVNIAKLAARLDQALALSVDMAVIQMTGRENELTGFNDRNRFGMRGVGHKLIFALSRISRKL